MKSVKNPISLARAVMEKTKHNYIIGESAEKLAIDLKLERMDASYFSTDKRREQLMKAKESDTIVNDHDLETNKKPIRQIDGALLPPRIQLASNFSQQIDFGVRILREEEEEGGTDSDEKSVIGEEVSTEESESRREIEKQDALDSMFPGSIGTVGCVCMFAGHVAAATSTGGLTNKMAGRIGEFPANCFPLSVLYRAHQLVFVTLASIPPFSLGDTPIIGAGTYANDATCAVSATGKGEEFMRHVAAYDVSARIEIGKSLTGIRRGIC